MQRLLLLTLIACATIAHADPQLTSWFTTDSGKYARIYATVGSTTTSTTWSRGTGIQTNPVYAGVNEVNSSTSWIYIRTSGLASYVMGPWPANFPNFPSNTATIYRIPRVPAVGSPKTNTGLGVIGRFVNGVSLFDNRDAFSYVNTSGTEVNPGDGIWARDAWVNEQATFDPALAHQAGNNYHNHAQPIALRYQLGDHVTFTAPSTYAEAVTAAAHSPIIAWAADGYPIYGPYGYSDPTNASSGVRRMVSGYTLRNGSNNTTNLTTAGRHTLPAWAATAQARSATLTAAQYGPDVSGTYPLGRYIEDNDYLGDLGFTQTTSATVRDFDLDQYNGRTCVTPDFPGGTYAYFTTINASGTPVFPYNIGRQFYGNPTGGARTEAQMNADTPLTQQFIGGANKPLTINTPGVAGTSITLNWSAVEGGTYSVDASTNQSAWTSKATGVVAATDAASSNYTALGSSGTEYGRIVRTAIATYDTNGQSAATVAQTTTTSYSLSGTGSPPTISNVTLTPAAPTSNDTVVVTANIAASSGRTISSAQLTYNNGISSPTTVFNEPFGTTAVANWTGASASNPWTITFGGPPSSPFNLTTASNHTTGSGTQVGVELIANAPNIANSTMTTTNNINAAGTSGTVTFWTAASGLTGTQGWDFQTSIDGSTFTTRASELTASNHGFQQTSYTLSATERVSTLKLRFRFLGPGGNQTPRVYLDDVLVTVGATSTPVNVTMLDDGAHGDGAAGDGVYGASIPAQPTSTTVTYTIAATDNTTAVTTTNSASYTVGAGPAVMSVTPATTLSATGNIGGAFTPASTSYTITNTGGASMTWTAGKTQSWLTLDSTSGTLAAGATATVSATINTAANSLSAGSYNDTITFANTTNGAGNSTRAVALSVTTPPAPGTPAITSLPTYSQGTAKTLTWAAVANATSYTIQVSTTSDFSTVLAAQTVTTNSAAFSNLTSGVTYYYRVLATNIIGSSSYSAVVSSLQDGVAPTVAITSPASATSTATATITISGTASDALTSISKVTVNGVSATTSDNFATWTVTNLPLGFGTNGITAVAFDGAGNATTTTPVNVTLTTAQTNNPLIVPEVMTGTTFNLNLHPTTKQFYAGTATNTYAYNNMLFWGPTLILNKGDWVQMNVTNNLTADTTTTHWHGFHIPAIMDGGPHQTIPAGTTWMPSFKVDNNAGLYWYHPHLHEKTQEHLSYGAGGLIIIRDPIEAALNLPRTYGVDDIPLALTSRRFTSNQIVTTASEYGDVMVVNGTLNPQVTLPKQYVRIRLLNAEMERSYNLGFSDGRTFYQIATDGGLVNAPVALTRLVLAVGERSEILVDLTNDTLGSSFNLQAFNSGQANDFPGGEPNNSTTAQFGSLLNNTTFTILKINVGAQTASPVLTRPTTLTTNTFYTAGQVTNTRTVTITDGFPGTGLPFSFDSTVYSPTLINQNVNLNAIEQWNITNTSGFSHSYHIHDIQFHLISRTGGNNTGIKSYEEGWKDVLFIAQNQTVSFIAKFDGFASDINPFMYHCHFPSHEDGGLMGQFVVKNNTTENLAVAAFTRYGSNSLIQLDFKATPGTTYTLQWSSDLTNWTDVGSVTSDGTSASFTETDSTRLSGSKGFYRVKIPTITQ